MHTAWQKALWNPRHNNGNRKFRCEWWTTNLCCTAQKVHLNLLRCAHAVLSYDTYLMHIYRYKAPFLPIYVLSCQIRLISEPNKIKLDFRFKVLIHIRIGINYIYIKNNTAEALSVWSFEEWDWRMTENSWALSHLFIYRLSTCNFSCKGVMTLDQSNLASN